MKSIDLIKPYFIEKRLTIGIGVVCLIAVDFLQLCIPRIIKRAVDGLTIFQIDKPDLFECALYLAGAAVLIGCLRFVWRNCLIGTSRRIEEGLRNMIFDHIQTLSASYFDHTKTGDLMARSTNDIQHIRMAVGMGVVALTDAVVLGAAAIGFMLYINVKLTALALMPMPFIVFGAKVFSKKMHRLYQLVQKTFSDMTELTRERFAGIRVIKIYNLQQAETAEFNSISTDYVNKNLKLVKIIGSFFPMMLLFSNLSLAVVLYFGGRQAIDFTITPGDFVAFIAYLGLLTWPMMAMGWVTNLIQRGRASLGRINDILKTRPDITDAADVISIKEVKEGVVFENVTFSYDAAGSRTGGPEALSKIDIKLAKGEMLGVIGPPGSGKTTLISLLPRISDTTSGRILIDGIDIRKLKLADLRSLISFAPQEPFLFAGTIRDNITFGNKQISDAQLNQAADDASFKKTVESFPNGFDTVVGEKGVLLSGGQKQRIALARALLVKKPILVLDDPISQVDMETGDHIVKTIRGLIGDGLVIIVSHRISAVRFADRIITLKNGRISESGSHAELIEQDGYYAKTFCLQEVEEECHV
ncbi:ABC transporter ATP-binding protein [Thermodesulfobacteriota bacterium]